jgi:surface antigen
MDAHMPGPARTIAAAAGLAAVLASPCAPAQNDLFAKDAPITRMTKDDFAIATGAMRTALDEGRDGQVYRWNNPATAASGTFTPLASFERQGMSCRGIVFTLEAGGKVSRSRWNVCRTPDGWKVDSGR